MTDLRGPHVTEDDRAAVEADRAAGRAEAAHEPTVAVDRVEDVDAGGVPSRLYTPAGATDALLYVHGGGFVMGDLVTHDGIARRLAVATGMAVLLVDYRLAPEHAWPAAADDTWTAADWLADRGYERLAIAGDSAGATLALGEVLRHPGRYDAQVLVYPFVDPAGRTYDRELAGVDLTLDRCAWFWRLYVQGADTSGDEAFHVLDRDSLAGLPRTLVQLAELDVLTPTGHVLADLLAGDGVPTEVVVYPRVPHGFWRRTDNDQGERAVADLARFLTAP